MIAENLISQVKRKLNITWDDVDTEARITEIIESAIPSLIHKLGITDADFDFSKPGLENTLFKNYCLYDWNHCLNEFDDNYANDIGQIRAIHEVKSYKQSEAVANEES